MPACPDDGKEMGNNKSNLNCDMGY